MVEDNILISKIDFKKFKFDFEQKIVPLINEKLAEGEIFAIKESEIKKLLCVDFCSTDNLYIKLRNVVTEKEFGVSIDKTNNSFIFFSKSGGMKRQSDILKVNFEEKLKPIIEKYLATNIELGIEENSLKERLGVPDYTTENIYQRLRNILSGSDIKVSVSKGDEKGFFFYRNKSEEEIRKEEENRRKEEKLEEERIDAKVEDAKRRDIERTMRFDEEILKLAPPPNFSDNFDPKDYNEDIEEGELNTDIVNVDISRNSNGKITFYTTESSNIPEIGVEYLCSKCSSIVVFNIQICPNCGTELNWS